MHRDTRLILLAKGIRTFSYGYLGVLFPIALAELGLDSIRLGGAVALTLLSTAAQTWAIREFSRRYAPARLLGFLASLIVVSGLLWLGSGRAEAVILAAMLGNLAVGTGETGPFLTLEQVLVARATPKERFAWVFSAYNLVGFVASALGAALVAWGAVPRSLLFAAFSLGGALQIVIYRALPAQAPPPRPASPSGAPSRPLIRKIALLFALDSFAGGFIVQSLVLYWFSRRFGLGLPALGAIAFGTQLITGLSYLLAPPLSRRIGLVNAMVFSHLVSNAVLVAIAFAPTAGWAVALLFLRHTLSQIDVPTRQAFLMSVVADHEREAAASLTNTSRALAQCLSPAFTGWMMQALSLAAPFVLGGTLKAVYDLLLYSVIRRHRPEEIV